MVGKSLRETGKKYDSLTQIKVEVFLRQQF